MSINLDLQFRWQPNFYDHIIRNEHELYAIRNYIRYNIENWDKDENNLNIQIQPMI